MQEDHVGILITQTFGVEGCPVGNREEMEMERVKDILKI